MKVPATIRINAVDDQGNLGSSDFGDGAFEWAKRQGLLEGQAVLKPEERASLNDWERRDVGWGVVLPWRKGLRGRELARADDAQPGIRKLLEARPDAPVLRYVREKTAAGTPPRHDKLTRYYADGTKQVLTIGNGPFGVEDGQLPRYLLIVGGPDEIPWAVQFAANRRHFAGRLALDDAALERYVEHLIAEWKGTAPDTAASVVWNTSDDPMSLAMQTAIAEPLSIALGEDADMRVTRVTGAHATGAQLVQTLTTSHPGTIVTVSHGRTGPLHDAAAMRAALGVPVGADGADLDMLAASAAQISGSVWLAYACCSAGCDEGSRFSGLLPAGSSAAEIVAGVASLGPTIAPLPQRLLSAEHPVAAFIGKIEPTFDWTLAEPDTGENVVLDLVDAVYPNLIRAETIGFALAEYFSGVGRLYGSFSDAKIAVDALEEGAEDRAVYYALTARDRESLVILGDPTVRLPALP
ncbi:hypothetical protein [Microbacterium sp. SS28]|uniref:hypothetical protein n=1 Tax=Microbacterium sp. SS28 TaxID=2919948 RepID=UPI001FAA15BD|nr:hypothetical protein [Microbacterium sp. SS28]